MRRSARLGLTAGLLLSLALDSSAGSPPMAAGYLGTFTWKMEEEWFGGFSGIEVFGDGTEFIALSDRGRVIQGRFQRDTEGEVTGIEAGPLTVLRGKGDARLRPGRSDSEGLAIAPDGTIYISFEGVARVLRYKSLTGEAENLPSAPEFARLQRNSALEALAIAPDGSLYTLPERSGGETIPFPVWRFDGSGWSHAFDLPRRGHFLPVGADFGPDGRLYVLEREFRGIFGFATRVRALTLGPGGLEEEEVVLETRVGRHDNLEGIAVWRDGPGSLRLTLVSDDNFSMWQETQIVEYRIPG